MDDSINVVLYFLLFLGYLFYKRGRWSYKGYFRKSYYYDYLKSDAWRRKRYVVLRRDNWKCQKCGAKATQVHHLKYAINIGREPIDWLISLCDDCHRKMH